MRAWAAVPPWLRGDTAGRLALMVLVFVAFSVADPQFANLSNVYAIFEGFAFGGAVALGIGVTMIAGELDLSVGSVAGACGVIAVKLSGLGVVGSVVVAVALACAFGAAQGWLIARLRISSLVFTVGTLVGVRGLAYLLASEQTAVLPLDRLEFADAVQAPVLVFSPFSLAVLGLFAAVGAMLWFSRYGREIHAMGGGRAAALAAGVPRVRPIVVAFTLSAGLAGFAGAMVSIKSGSAPPSALDTLLLPGVTAALIGGVALTGGRGNVVGIFAGAMVLRFLSSELSLKGQQYYVESLATGVLLLIVLAFEMRGHVAELRDRLRLRQPAPEG